MLEKLNRRGEWIRHTAIVLLLPLAAGGLRAQIRGGMLDPGIDPAGQPFSYFWHPTDVIGTLYAPAASEITPEGYVYTGFGELMFFTGNPLVPVNQRLRTLFEGHLPCVQYGFTKEGVAYDFSAFAANVADSPDSLPVNFIRVALTNRSARPRAAFLSAGYRFRRHADAFIGPVDRFTARLDVLPAALVQNQMPYNPKWNYAFAPGELRRDGRIIYLCPVSPPYWQRSIALDDNGLGRRVIEFLSGEVEGTPPASLPHEPTTVMGVVTYRLMLRPAESRTLDFKLPLVPLPEGSPMAEAVRAARYDVLFASTMNQWRSVLRERQAPIRIPEAKVQEALLANTVFNLLAIDRIGPDTVVNVNKFQYHGFYSTDSSLMYASLDDMGLGDLVGRAARYDLKAQLPDGFFGIVSPGVTASNQPTDYESFGYVLWAWNRHFALSQDRKFLSDVYPAVLRAFGWERRMTGSDSLGLLPAPTQADNAFLSNCRQTGQDMWTLTGLRCGARMARAMGQSGDQVRFEAEERRLRAAFERQLARQTAKTGGYIPPALDRTLAGNDWDNLHTLYPEPLFDPADPRVAATISASRANYSEGIQLYRRTLAMDMVDGQLRFESIPTLHYWRTDDAENQLVRDTAPDQKEVVENLYALLVHTTSTHATQEWGTAPWSTRDHFSRHNLLPDGSASATLIELMRNMLVREYRDELHLFSALSPEWISPGKRIALEGEPTAFGPVTAALTENAKGLNIRLNNRFHQTPSRLVIHIPWFFAAKAVEIDGLPAPTDGETVAAPPMTGEIEIEGAIRRDTVPLSYERAVAEYLEKYRRHYERFLETGEVSIRDN